MPLTSKKQKVMWEFQFLVSKISISSIEKEIEIYDKIALDDLATAQDSNT